MLAVVLVAEAAYIAIYATLSMYGRYEPISVGAAGVKEWTWAPLGFHRRGEWNYVLAVPFMPLFICDEWIWHANKEGEQWLKERPSWP